MLGEMKPGVFDDCLFRSYLQRSSLSIVRRSSASRTAGSVLFSPLCHEMELIYEEKEDEEGNKLCATRRKGLQRWDHGYFTQSVSTSGVKATHLIDSKLQSQGGDEDRGLLEQGGSQMEAV